MTEFGFTKKSMHYLLISSYSNIAMLFYAFNAFYAHFNLDIFFYHWTLLQGQQGGVVVITVASQQKCPEKMASVTSSRTKSRKELFALSKIELDWSEVNL